MRLLRQSTSVDVPIGPFLDETDGKTAETALSVTQPDVRLKKNNANWAQKNAAQTLTHEENGNYEVTLDATDTNTLGLLRLHVAKSGALPIWEDFMVLTANVWDSFFSTAILDVNVLKYVSATQTATIDVSGVVASIYNRIPAALVSGRMDSSVGAIDAGPVDTILDDQIGDSTITVRQALKLLVAVLGGKLSGAGTTTVTIRNAADTANVVVATVDSSGNRSAVTLTL